MRRTLGAIISVAAICFSTSIDTTRAQERGQPKPTAWADASKITPVYGPASDELRPIRDALVAAKVLERLQRFLAPLRLKQNLTVQTAECGPPAAGRHYSFVPYQRGKPVTICYEFVGLIMAVAPDAYVDAIGQTLVTRDMAIEGPFVQEVLHNVALAVFDQLDIPIWGNLDDAADNVAALSMMYFGNGVALKSILGSAYFLQKADEAITRQTNQQGQVVGHVYDLTYLADVRAPMLQRYYNMLCVAVGKDPLLFSSFIAIPPAKPTALTFALDKAKDCGFVYREAADGFTQTILDKYVDKTMLAQIANTDWYAAP
jgi:hypothetical protein